MIVLAREARGFSQKDLAEKIDMSPTNLSKIERGDVGIAKDVLEGISRETEFPIHFFTQEGTIIPENLIYRKRQSVPQKFIAPIQARVNILSRHVQFLTRALNIYCTPAPYSVPKSYIKSSKDCNTITAEVGN